MTPTRGGLLLGAGLALGIAVGAAGSALAASPTPAAGTAGGTVTPWSQRMGVDRLTLGHLRSRDDGAARCVRARGRAPGLRRGPRRDARMGVGGGLTRPVDPLNPAPVVGTTRTPKDQP